MCKNGKNNNKIKQNKFYKFISFRGEEKKFLRFTRCKTEEK